MGRHKIHISRITDDRARQCTFAKRRVGAFKKAMELSILCGCDVALITFSPTGKLHLYSSRSLDQILTRLSEHSSSPFRSLSNADYETEYGSIDNPYEDEELDEDEELEQSESARMSGGGVKRKRPTKKAAEKASKTTASAAAAAAAAADDVDDGEEYAEADKGPSINPHNGHRAPDANNARNRMGFEQVKFAAMLATSCLSSQPNQQAPQPEVMQPAYTVRPATSAMQAAQFQPSGVTPSLFFAPSISPVVMAAAPQQMTPVPATSPAFTQSRMVIAQRPVGGKDCGVQQFQTGSNPNEMTVFCAQPMQQPKQVTATQQAEIAKLQSALIAQQQQQLQQQQQQQQMQQPPQQRARLAAQSVVTSGGSPPTSPSPLTAFSAQPRLSIQDLLSLTAIE